MSESQVPEELENSAADLRRAGFDDLADRLEAAAKRAREDLEDG